MPSPVLVPLRRGGHGVPVYMFPGSGADVEELSPIVRALTCPNPIMGADYPACVTDDATPLTVIAIAQRCFAEIRAAQPSGPYHLMGYSFGGLVAIEVARLLRGCGQEIGSLILIDTYFDQRFWPPHLFLLAQIRRAFWHLRQLTTRAPGAAFGEFSMRARNLMVRLGERVVQSAAHRIAAASVNAPVSDQCIAAITSYEPSRYDGPITVLSAEIQDDFACNSALLWRKYCDFVTDIVIPGAHLATVRDPQAILRLTSVIDQCVAGPGAVPAKTGPVSILVMNAFHWPAAAHIARSFHEGGATIDVLGPEGHELTKLPFVNARHPYSTFRPLASLRAAIEAAEPDLLVACDDQIAAQLHQLYESTQPGDSMRPLLSRSLGSPENFPLVYSRSGIARLAQDLDVPGPETEAVADIAALRKRLGASGFPAVLKIDGSSGGRGVAIANSTAEAERAFAKLSAWPGFPRALKHLLVNRDATLIKRVLRGQRNMVSLQKYVEGRPGNAAVACWDGKVLAAVLVEVLDTLGPTGPATMVRVIRHSGMSAAIEKMVGRLKLSGLCGFDFILRADDGSAHLIELNPRATPTSYLVTADGKVLSAALHSQLRGDGAVVATHAPNLEPLTMFSAESRPGR